MDESAIQRYQIQEKIGAGGMGTVYRAWDRDLERNVALKWLPAYLGNDDTFTERFKREIRVIAHLEHPHIVPIYDVGESEGRPFIIMRLLEGGTLRDRIKAGGFNLAELLTATEQIAKALAAAHERQIIHRDIKPGNILFDKSGSAFLSDFGIAKVLDSGTQLTGSGFIGTPAYMSPEQFTGHGIDGRSDQYSLAVVVYEALTGALPFEGNTAQMMFNHINTAVPEIDLTTHPIPSGLNPILQKSLSKEPGARYARVTDFSTALAIAMRMEPATASVLLPVIVGAPPVKPPGSTAAATELDTPLEGQSDPTGDDYRAGLEALALGEYATAVAAFDRVLAVAPDYAGVAEFSRQARAGLQQTTAAGRAGTGATATAVDKTQLEPISGGAGYPPEPPLYAPLGQPAAQPEKKRAIPIWAYAVPVILLLLLGGYAASQTLGASPEPEPAAVFAAVPATATAAPAETNAPPPATETAPPAPSATASAATETPLAEPTAGEEDGTGKSEDNTTRQPVIRSAVEDATDEPTATVEPTAETPVQDAPQIPAVRIIVSSANLRLGPGTLYQTAGAVLAGQELPVLASNGDRSWYNVELPNGSRAWVAASVTEAVNGPSLANVPLAATIPAAPTLTPVPPTATRIILPTPTSTSPPIDGGGGGGGDGGGDGGGEPEPPPRYTAEPP